MVYSASIATAEASRHAGNNAAWYLMRHGAYLAIALVGRPELVFVDEPTAGMDPQARRTTWEMLEEVRADGVALGSGDDGARLRVRNDSSGRVIDAMVSGPGTVLALP